MLNFLTMIKIVIEKDEQEIINSIKVNGHACSAEEGKDLVCAAVSAIMVGGANALKNKSDFEIILEKGNALIKKKKTGKCEDDKVMLTIVTQLLTIEESYSKFIKVQIK